MIIETQATVVAVVAIAKNFCHSDRMVKYKIKI